MKSHATWLECRRHALVDGFDSVNTVFTVFVEPYYKVPFLLAAVKSLVGQRTPYLPASLLSLSSRSWKTTPPWATFSRGCHTPHSRNSPTHIWRKRLHRSTILPLSYLQHLSSSSLPLRTTSRPWLSGCPNKMWVTSQASATNICRTGLNTNR